jgi:CDP-2,3-bis-(O-geranylgeranyl)-sn-glycerol synthase
MDIFEILNFVIPCWFINIGLNTFKFIPGIKKTDKPLDRGIVCSDNNRLLGPSTTLLGLPFALLFGLIVGIIFYDWKIGLVLGFAAYLGHAIGSFIKRRLGVKPGKFFPFLDHGDYIITAGLILYFLQVISLPTVFFSTILTWIVQPLLCYTGYKLKLRDDPL